MTAHSPISIGKSRKCLKKSSESLKKSPLNATCQASVRLIFPFIRLLSTTYMPSHPKPSRQKPKYPGFREKTLFAMSQTKG
jgi:hypothetical protein